MNISYVKIPGKVIKDQFFSTFESMIKKMLLDKGELRQPIACILDPILQEMVLIYLDFTDDKTKMMSIKLIKTLCSTIGVKMFCFASEVWMAQRSKEDGNELAERLKHDPEFRIAQLQDKIECLIISNESTEPEMKGTNQVIFQMIRDAEEKLLLLKEHNRFDQNSSAKMTGNLMNILDSN